MVHLEVFTTCLSNSNISKYDAMRGGVDRNKEIGDVDSSGGYD